MLSNEIGKQIEKSEDKVKLENNQQPFASKKSNSTWFIDALNMLLTQWVTEKERVSLKKKIEKQFLISFSTSSEHTLESKLLILCYMAKIYQQKENKEFLSKTDIIKDLQVAIIIAEKVVNELGIWVSDFEQFGDHEILIKHERFFLGNKLKFKTHFDPKLFEQFIQGLNNRNIEEGFLDEFIDQQIKFPSSNAESLNSIVNNLKVKEKFPQNKEGQFSFEYIEKLQAYNREIEKIENKFTTLIKSLEEKKQVNRKKPSLIDKFEENKQISIAEINKELLTLQNHANEITALKDLPSPSDIPSFK